MTPAPVSPRCFDLVVAGPQHNARVITQSLHVVDCFRAYVVEKLLRGRIHAAREHVILPDEDSHLVTQLIKVVSFVNAAAPNAQHVHVGVVH